MTITVPTDSYITLAESNTYFDAALHGEDWETTGNDDKEKALKTAFRSLNRQYWRGTKTDDNQVGSFPQEGLIDRDGIAIDPDTVPPDIEDAQAELALAFLLDPSLQSQSTATTNTKRVKAGSVEVEFFKSVAVGRYPTIVQELVKPYLAAGGNITVGINAGQDNESAFSSSDWRLKDGYG